ncbi:MAG TPA: hypothetical protein DHV36_25605 [Desulfobacteraceae bacterium]|nr:hypothetical protein [Desulfobacteraceae bacterium]
MCLYMTQTNRFWKFVGLSLTGILIFTGFLVFLIWRNLGAGQSRVLYQIFQENLYTLLGLAFLILGSLWVVFDITYNRYILPLKRMAAEAGMIYDSNPSHRIRVRGSRDIREMARVINDFADMFENLNKTITQQILTARKETEKERNLLAAIMGELPQGIVVCNKNGRIILFNSLAKSLFTPEPASGSSEFFLGLGRSVFHLVDKALITHAMDEIIEQMNTPDTSIGSFFITPIAAGRLISAEAIPVLDNERRMTGFILALKDVSERIEKYQTVDNSLKAFRQLIHAPEPISPEVMVASFDQMAQVIKNITFSSLPLTTLPLDTFLPMIQKKAAFQLDVRVNIFRPPNRLRILADTYSITQVFLSVFKTLASGTRMQEFDLSVSDNEKQIGFHISWDGTFCTMSLIEAMIKERLNGLPSLGYILKFNNARLTPLTRDKEKCTGIGLTFLAGKPSGSARKSGAPVISNSRPEYYDFNLFNVTDSVENVLDTPLKKLTYTVFDTETTGLNTETDEIISIGAVRIVNQRIAYQDSFEELINPERDIPIAAYKIHGISYEMVREKPTIKAVLPAFKTFASNTVLLGHNLAFDMKMIKVKEPLTGIRFDNPALDTLLLSAVLHPVHQQHDLENIARRLGVNILGRHTALGDAITTAEIFLKLLPILNSNGILTLKDALRASKKTYYARLKY